MSKFRNILFVADKAKGETAALVKMLQLATLSSATVTVIGVLAEAPSGFFAPDAEIDLTQLHEEMVRERRKELADLAKTAARQAGATQPGVLLKEGIDYIEIIRQVQAGKHDLLAKANDNNTGLVGVLFGTLDMQLLRKCPCPVFIIKQRKKMAHAKVVAAVDLDRSNRKRILLDRQVVRFAASIAGMEEGSLDLLHAWHLPYEKNMRNEEKIRGVKTVDLLLKHTRELKQRGLEALAAEWEALGPGTRLIKGLPQHVIPRYVKTEGSDLVVMGSVGRSGIAGFFVGNTAEKILQALDCSVLAIKPQGFKTPVRPGR